MARPIKDTPILRGKDAIRFEEMIANPQPISQERRERIRRAGELMDKMWQGPTPYTKWW